MKSVSKQKEITMSEFGTDHALIHEAVVTGRKVGAGKEFWAALAHNKELFDRVVTLVMSTVRVVFPIVANIDRAMHGWGCFEPVEVSEGDFEPFLQEFLQKEDNDSLGGEETVKRAKELGVFTGLRHAEAMLRNQERIPVEWRKYHLVFPEVWEGPDGAYYVFCLFWGGKHWFLRCNWLISGFGPHCRLVASKHQD